MKRTWSSAAAIGARRTICGLRDVANRSIGERVRDVLTGLTKHEQAFADCQRDHQALAEAEASLVGVRESLSGLEVAEAKWRAAWTPALQALGLPAESQVEAAAAAAMEWASAVGVLTTIETTQRRIKRMDEDEAELEARVSAVVAKIGLRAPEDSVATAGMI